MTSNVHNTERSRQNLECLQKLGIANRESLRKYFDLAYKKGVNIKVSNSPYGTTITKRIQVNEKGALDVGFFYKGGDMSVVPKVSTIIPKTAK